MELLPNKSCHDVDLSLPLLFFLFNNTLEMCANIIAWSRHDCVLAIWCLCHLFLCLSWSGYTSLLVSTCVNLTNRFMLSNKTRHQCQIQSHLYPIFWTIPTPQFWPHAIIGNLDVIIKAPCWISYPTSILPIEVVKYGYVNSLSYYSKTSWRHLNSVAKISSSWAMLC